MPGSLLNTTALEPARGSSPSPANRQDFNTLSVMRGKRPGALLRRAFAIHTRELPMKNLLRLALTGALVACSSGLFAPSVFADPEITSDPSQVPSAVSPPTPDTLQNGKRALKLDYGGAFPGLHIVLPPPSDEEKQAMARSDSKRRVIGFHRGVPGGYEDDLSPRLDWIGQADGSFVASLLVTSPEAESVRVGIRAELSPSGEIRFFGVQSDERFAVVTREDFPIVGGEMETRWSPTVDGDTIGVEITLPSEKAVDAFRLRIDALAHSLHSMSSLDTAPKQLECPNIHIDVPCRSGSTHSTLEDAVARIRFEEGVFSYVCSGALMNDTVQGTFIPYFLTAEHCISTASVARTVEAWWFYQRAQCGRMGLDSRRARTTSGTDLLATRPGSDLTLLRFRGSLPGGLFYSGSSTRSISHPAGVYGIHHPGGEVKKYSEGVTTRNVDGCTEDLAVCIVNAIGVRWSEGTVEGGSSGSGLFLRDGGYLVGGLAAGEECGFFQMVYYSPFRDFYPRIRRWLSPEDGTLGAADVVLPLVPRATNRQQQGFVRVFNRSEQSGEVAIHAVDDTGERFGPAHLFLEAKESKNFNSRDLERGNASLELDGGVGSGTGDWRVELRADFDIGARAYIRTPDGFLTPMHQAARETSDGSLRYHVTFFNPATNTSFESLLRVVNPGTGTAAVVISGVDARGNAAPLGEVRLSLDGGEATPLLSARDLERGAAGLQGRLGDGAGKWQLYVSSDRPLLVVGLMKSRSGHLSNLSE